MILKRVSKHSCDDILVIQKTHTYVLILTPVTSSERFMFLVFSMLTFLSMNLSLADFFSFMKGNKSRYVLFYIFYH